MCFGAACGVRLRPLRREARCIDMARVTRRRRRGGSRTNSTSIVAATAVIDRANRIERGHAQERRATSPGQHEERRAEDRRVVQPLHEPAAPSEALLYEHGDHGEAAETAAAMDAGREVVDGAVDCRNSW
jgi:hypothetical protein